MIKLKVHHQNLVDTVEVDENTLLLDVLRDNGYEIYAPCGGNGTCGKCKVWLKGEGSIASCLYPVTKSVEIVLPEKKEARILVEQHSHTRPVPFMPGASQNLSYYPHGVALDLGTTSLVFYFVNLVTGSVVETRWSTVVVHARWGAELW